MEQALIQHTLPFTARSISDLEGLVLNITVPKDTSPTDELPVFVFVHGGGFFIGSGSWPETDPSHLVKLSATNGKPVIGISIKCVDLTMNVSHNILTDIATAWALLVF